MLDLLDLPNEILIKVFRSLHRDALTALGKTCSRLNALAYKVYFETHGFPLPEMGTVVITDSKHPWTYQGMFVYSLMYAHILSYAHLHILRCWVTSLHHLQNITIRSTQGDLHKLLAWVSELQAVVDYTKQLNDVHLTFGLSDASNMTAFKQITLGITSERWKSIICTLYESIVRKNPQYISLHTGNQMLDIARFTPPSVRRTKLQGIMSQGTSWLKRLSSTLEGVAPSKSGTLPTSPPTGMRVPCSSRLTKVTIHSDMLMAPLFHSWTASLLQTHAHTIAELDLKTTTTDRTQWTKLLRDIHIPNLTVLQVYPGGFVFDLPPLPQKTLHAGIFIARHPTITKLAIEEQEYHQRPKWIIHSQSPEDLPQLRTLVGTSRLINAILNPQTPPNLIQLEDLTCVGSDVEGLTRCLEHLPHYPSLRKVAFRFDFGNLFKQTIEHITYPLPPLEGSSQIIHLAIHLPASVTIEVVWMETIFHLINIFPKAAEFHLVRYGPNPTKGKSNDEFLRPLISQRCTQVKKIVLQGPELNAA